MFYIPHAAFWRRIPAVKKDVDIDIPQAVLLCHAEKRKEVIDMAVHTTVRDKAEEMKERPFSFAFIIASTRALFLEKQESLTALSILVRS